MRLSAALALLCLAVTVAACDSTPGVTSCPDTGVVTVADAVVGTGQAATPSSNVIVNYVGRLASDGTVFDSSRAAVGFSFTDPTRRPILGFRQGIAGRSATEADSAIVPMRIGGRRRIFIPTRYAYGAFPPAEVIPQCADLIFDVELVDL